MRAKSLLILLLLLGLLAAAAALLVHRQASQRAAAVLGTSLLADFPANDVASMTIASADGKVSLSRREGRWVVKERFDYPANFGRIAELVRTLKEAKMGSRFEGTAEVMARLALKDPDDPQAPQGQKGTRIVLKNDKEKVLASVLVGSVRKPEAGARIAAGRYVRLGDSPAVYLIDEELLWGPQGPAAWLAKELVKVSPEEVKRITCVTADGRRTVYAFERPDKDREFHALRLPASQKVQPQELTALNRALRNLWLQDVLGPGAAGLPAGEFPYRLDYELFDGTVYSVYPGKKCSEAEGCLIRLEVSYRPPAPGKGKTGETPPAAAAGKQDPQSEARALNERLSAWVYRISAMEHQDFKTDLSQLLAKGGGGQGRTSPGRAGGAFPFPGRAAGPPAPSQP
jgi:hypothetical protein